MNTKPNNYIYSDTLMHKNGHFKYIKKVKGKNGKTRYYYLLPPPDSDFSDYKDAYQKMKEKAGSNSIDDNKNLKLDSEYLINVGKTLIQEMKIGQLRQLADLANSTRIKGRQWLFSLFGGKKKKKY